MSGDSLEAQVLNFIDNLVHKPFSVCTFVLLLLNMTDFLEVRYLKEDDSMDLR